MATHQEQLVQAIFALAAPSTLTSPWQDTTMSYFAKQMGLDDEFLGRSGNAKRQDMLAMWMHPDIAGALETRRAAVVAAPYRFVPPLGVEMMNDNHAFVAGEMQKVMRALLAAIWSAVPHGTSVVDVVYENRADGKLGISKVLELPFERFETTALGETFQHGGTDKTPINEDKIFVTRRNPSSRNPNGEMLLAKLYVPWKYHVAAMDYWLSALEKVGTPFLVAKLKEPHAQVQSTTGATISMIEAVTAALDNAKRGSAMVVGGDDEISSIDVSNVGAQFELVHRALVEQIQILVLGQTLTSSVHSGGSYAAAKVHNAVRKDKRDEDLALVSGTVQRIVDTLWRLNEFPDAPPLFEFVQDVDLNTERASRDAALLPILSASGIRLNAAYFIDNYGIAQEYIEESQGQNTAGAFAVRKAGFVELGDALTDAATASGPQPLDVQLIKKAALGASNEDEFITRLNRYLTPEQLAAFAEFATNVRASAAVFGADASDRGLN